MALSPMIVNALAAQQGAPAAGEVGPAADAGLGQAPMAPQGPEAVPDAAAPASMPSPASIPPDPLQVELDQHEAQYGLLQEGEASVSRVQDALNELTKLGDMVSQEDVVRAAGELVASGLDTKAMAAMLAEMPPDGEALQAWLLAKDAQLKAISQQLNAALEAKRFDLGAAAMKQLVAQGARQRLLQDEG